MGIAEGDVIMQSCPKCFRVCGGFFVTFEVISGMVYKKPNIVFRRQKQRSNRRYQINLGRKIYCLILLRSSFIMNWRSGEG